MRRSLPIAWFISFCLLILSGFSFATDIAPNSVGTLSWKNTRAKPTLSIDAAKLAASQYLGQTATTDQAAFVQITDSARYGNVTSTVFYGWQLHYSGIAIKNAKTGETGTVNLTLLINGADQVSGGWPAKALVAAFTDPNLAAWQPPVLPQRSYTQEMQADGWNVSRPQTKAPQSSISQVLDAFWASNGIDPRQAGQLMLQPMQANPLLPAKRSGNKLVPLLSSGLYWTILVNGTKTHVITGPKPIKSGTSASEGADRYMSGLIALYSNLGAQSLRGVYLP